VVVAVALKQPQEPEVIVGVMVERHQLMELTEPLIVEVAAVAAVVPLAVKLRVARVAAVLSLFVFHAP
jgi:hypothetical protein